MKEWNSSYKLVFSSSLAVIILRVSTGRLRVSPFRLRPDACVRRRRPGELAIGVAVDYDTSERVKST